MCFCTYVDELYFNQTSNGGQPYEEFKECVSNCSGATPIRLKTDCLFDYCAYHFFGWISELYLTSCLFCRVWPPLQRVATRDFIGLAVLSLVALAILINHFSIL